MRCDWPYSLKPLRRSVGYAFSVFRSVRPATYTEKSSIFPCRSPLCGNIGDVSTLQHRLDALATKVGEISGLTTP